VKVKAVWRNRGFLAQRHVGLPHWTRVLQSEALIRPWQDASAVARDFGFDSAMRVADMGQLLSDWINTTRHKIQKKRRGVNIFLKNIKIFSCYNRLNINDLPPPFFRAFWLDSERPMRLLLRQFFEGIVFQNRLEKRRCSGEWRQRSQRSMAVHSLNNPHKRMVILRGTLDDFIGKVLPENEPCRNFPAFIARPSASIPFNPPVRPWRALWLCERHFLNPDWHLSSK